MKTLIFGLGVLIVGVNVFAEPLPCRITRAGLHDSYEKICSVDQNTGSAFQVETYQDGNITRILGCAGFDYQYAEALLKSYQDSGLCLKD